ncbi:MAG: sensor histidine kinase [Lautropia sp.]
MSRKTPSLRRTLLLVLLPGVLLVAAVEVVLTWRATEAAANAAFDRSLAGAIKSIDANVSTASGGLAVELPYRLLEFFELTASGNVYYRVATEGGLVDIGNADLPPPPRSLATGQPAFEDARYFGETIRVGSYARALARPLAGDPAEQRIVIQVAESLDSRRAFTRRLLFQTITRDLMLVFVAAAALALAIDRVLRPLGRLRREVDARAPDDLRPIPATGVPADVQPLVEAINHHIARNRDQAERLRLFVDDASHQLRTPLTTLATQVGVALREDDPARQRAALVAIKRQVEDTVRRTNQMLALARADTSASTVEAVDLRALAEACTREWWVNARERGIDLGFDAAPDRAMVAVQPALLGEALTNLLHNALVHVPAGGHVTVRVHPHGTRVAIEVVDDGPGIPEDELHRAGERFFRASTASDGGTGLGLAIVRAIAERHGGELRVAANPAGRGLSVSILLPRLDAGDAGTRAPTDTRENP